MRPRTAQRLRQLAGKKNSRKRAVVIKIAAAVAFKLHGGTAGSAEIEHHKAALPQHANRGPCIGRATSLPRTRRLQGRNIERQLTELPKQAGKLRDAPCAPGPDILGQTRVQREIGRRRVPSLRRRPRARQIDANDADPVVVDIHLKKREEAPLEIAQVAFKTGKAIADAGLEPCRDRIAGDHPWRAAAPQRSDITWNKFYLGSLAHADNSSTRTRSPAKYSGRSSIRSQ